ncbi:MAG: preprotein translocase subunit YajC [Synergistaceae bacterium]|jgi:preprotein translocase YajC subunit|nr:preprotein translocase subunit YajC [Synergistaceae bacterium]
MQFVTMLSMLFFVLFLNFAVIRPHRLRQRRRDSMLASVGEGLVIYAAGIRGTVVEVRRASVIIATGPCRVILEIDKSSVELVESVESTKLRRA